MRGDSGEAGEGRVAGIPKFHFWDKYTMPLTNINSDWMSNASSGLCNIILYYLYYTGLLSCILGCNEQSNHTPSLIPRFLCGGGGREPGTHCSRMRQFPFVTCVLLCYTKITMSAYLLKAALHSHTSCGTHTSDLEVNNSITLTVTVCIASFEVISELQRERSCQSRAKALSWNGRMRGQFLQVKS